MRIEWIGHACFSITSDRGLKIITDPYEPGFRNIINYNPVNESAGIVTVSHEHGDHNHIAAVSGNPTVVQSPGTTRIQGTEFRGIHTFHDSVQGAERGSNTIFSFEVDGVNLTHLGDLGHPLSAGQLKELAGTNVLLAPTGGPTATLEIEEVIDLWEQLEPEVVIPMHYVTAGCAFPRYGVEDLVRLRPAARKVGGSAVSLSKGGLPAATQVLILDPAR